MRDAALWDENYVPVFQFAIIAVTIAERWPDVIGAVCTTGDKPNVNTHISVNRMTTSFDDRQKKKLHVWFSEEDDEGSCVFFESKYLRTGDGAAGHFRGFSFALHEPLVLRAGLANCQFGRARTR